MAHNRGFEAVERSKKICTRNNVAKLNYFNTMFDRPASKLLNLSNYDLKHLYFLLKSKFTNYYLDLWPRQTSSCHRRLIF